MNIEWLNHNAGLRGLGMSRTGSSHWRQYMVAGWGPVAAAVRWSPEWSPVTPPTGRLFCGERQKCQPVRETQQIHQQTLFLSSFAPSTQFCCVPELVGNFLLSEPLSWGQLVLKCTPCTLCFSGFYPSLRVGRLFSSAESQSEGEQQGTQTAQTVHRFG